MSRCCLSASHTPSITWVAPRTLIRSGSSTNHIPILRVLLEPTTHSRECFSGARNSINPSPTVSIAKASMSLLFHTALFSSFSCAARKACRLHYRLRAQASPQPCIPRSYEARRRTAIRARIPRPTSATAATSGRETPPVSGNFGATLAEALADGLADAAADGLADALAEGVVISPPPETLTLAVIWGWIVHW